jgi:predicted short-subunit dehydrogenase-like oxidoreductase (DUF2520 family)
MSNLPNISILGCGKVGTALGMLAARAGAPVVAVASRRRCQAKKAAEAIGGAVRVLDMREAAAIGGLILLTVSDDAIAPVCAELARAKAFWPDAVVAHCSGALASDVLAPARACGCSAGSMHPLQTFPTVVSAVQRMPGTHFFVEGDGKAVESLEEFVRAVGGRPSRIAAEDKALYHAAASMACNYLVALLEGAARLAEGAGIRRNAFLRAVEPLIQATVDNVYGMDAGQALTGPIARGDVETLRRQLGAVAACGDEALRKAFFAMGQATVDLAVCRGTIEESAAQAMRALLREAKE